MRIPVEETPLKHHLPKAARERPDELLADELRQNLVGLALLLGLLPELSQRRAVQVIHHQHALGDHPLDRPGRVQKGLVTLGPVRLPLKQVVDLVHGVRLRPKVQLILHALCDLREDQVVVEWKEVLKGLCELDDVLDVAPELWLDEGSHDLDGDDLAALERGLVDLRHRGTAQGYVLEVSERAFDGRTVQQLAGDHLLHHRGGEGVEAVLQLGQSVDVGGREEVDPRRDELPALDVEALELVHGDGEL
mmetsp:Transcript_13310/g.33589  ORF Transcript_13310/g.33589 Transcript_13310/m.33589 type:complete len:249 (+) Transcript_13310:652-1398(+)